MNGHAEPVVVGLRAEYPPNPAIGLGATSPRLSWHTVTSAPDWAQTAYEVEVAGTSCGRVDGRDSVFVPWPTTPLRSREARPVRVRVWADEDGEPSPWSERLAIEAGLLHPTDWAAHMVAPDLSLPADEDGPADCSVVRSPSPPRRSGPGCT